MNETEALAVIVLWDSRYFDTNEIARLLRIEEAAVSRTIGAARAIARDDPAARGGA